MILFRGTGFRWYNESGQRISWWTHFSEGHGEAGGLPGLVWFVGAIVLPAFLIAFIKRC